MQTRGRPWQVSITISRHVQNSIISQHFRSHARQPAWQDGIRNILVRQQMLRRGRRTIEVHTSTTYAVNATRCVCVLWGWERTGGVGYGGVRQWIPVHCALLKLPSHCCVQLLGRLSIPTPGTTRSIHELRVAYTSWAANGRTTRNLCFMPPEVRIINVIKGKFGSQD